MGDMKVVNKRAPFNVLAEDRVRQTHDFAVKLGENRPCLRVGDGEALRPQRPQVPGSVVVEEGSE